MTFDEFRQEMKLTENEAQEIVHYLAAMRMRQTLGLLDKIPPDKTTSEIIEDQRRS